MERHEHGELPHLVVAGNGMAGVACLEEILKHGRKFRITVFGDEARPHYDRTLLPAALAGEKSLDDLTLHPVEWYREQGVELRLGVRIVDVDADAKTVTAGDGGITGFDKLLLATGASPVIPPIAGVKQEGVFVFRSVADARGLLERARPGLKAVVIGGGLLGLEAARGLRVHGCEVTVVHLTDTLMERQLDAEAGSWLARRMEALGVRLLLRRRTRALLGEERLEAVEFFGGEKIDADLAVIAAGIRPNVDLGLCAGLTVNRGIVVNDYMETSHPDIFAAGECVEHRGVCYGHLAPALEQSKVLAASIAGQRGPVYQGTLAASKLNVPGLDVFSAGDFQGDAESIRHEDASRGVYRKLVFNGGVLKGVILLGDDSDRHRYLDWLRTGEDPSASPEGKSTRRNWARVLAAETFAVACGDREAGAAVRPPRAGGRRRFALHCCEAFSL